LSLLFKHWQYFNCAKHRGEYQMIVTDNYT